MYLSKVSLASSDHARASLLELGKNGAYAAHQLLWKLFTNDDKRDFLFREEQSTQGLPIFYVLSKNRPLELHQLFDIQTKAYAPNLQRGNRLAYKLRVNPTVVLKTESGKSKRHDVLMNAKKVARSEGVNDDVLIEQRMNQAAQGWLANVRRLEDWGVQLDTLPDIESYLQHKVVKSRGDVIKFSSVDMQGTLTVIEPIKFISQLMLGVGRSKSLGCGLMLVRRI